MGDAVSGAAAADLKTEKRSSSGGGPERNEKSSEFRRRKSDLESEGLRPRVRFSCPPTCCFWVSLPASWPGALSNSFPGPHPAGGWFGRSLSCSPELSQTVSPVFLIGWGLVWSVLVLRDTERLGLLKKVKLVDFCGDFLLLILAGFLYLRVCGSRTFGVGVCCGCA